MSYDWKRDSIGCWHEWLRWMRIASGLATFATPAEMYLVEARGMIP